MKTLHQNPFRLIDAPNTVKPWHYIWRVLACLLAFGALPYLLFAYLLEAQDWLKTTFDTSDQMRTGIVMLLIGSFTFGVLLVWGCFKRN